MNFFDSNVWGGLILIAVLFSSLLLANIVKKNLFKNKCVPNSVLGGCILLIISTICYYTTGDYLFNLPIFDENGLGIQILEQITYHCLGIGFIAMTLRPATTSKNANKGAGLDSGILTVSGYLIQAVPGILITLIASRWIKDLSPGSGMLLCFGFGQGTGQALNIGKNIDATAGTAGIYADMGLSLAALGFLVASICGVMYLNYLKRKGKLVQRGSAEITISLSEVQADGEVPESETVDKLSIQVGLVLFCYVIAYGMMYLLGNILPGLKGTIFGFNFVLGALAAVIVKGILNILRKKGIMKHEYANIYLMNRISGFAFDLMIVAGICAIQIDLIKEYVGVILVLGLVGTIITYYYTKFVCKKIFPDYEYEQFFAWFGMLTGTASTGMMLLREVDPKLETPVSNNMVLMNFTAMAMGFPLLFLANLVSGNPYSEKSAITVVLVCIAYFVVLNVILFRRQIFKKR